MSNGQIGYEAYARSTGGKTFDGRDMPTWAQVQERTPHVAKAWEDAATAIRLVQDDTIEQLRTQLAGCSVAALGGTSPESIATPGMYGWSLAYADVLALRQRHDEFVMFDGSTWCARPAGPVA